ncbi:endo-beta-N-acetylglucosaminidase [Streptomyces sp. NPDC055144]
MADDRSPVRPYMHGYDAAALKSWSPGTDRWARHFRSRVPLAPRIAPFPATQAHPDLATGPQLMNLTYDYDDAFFTARKYGDAFARRLLRFWQYSDFYGSWHGLPVDGSPADDPAHGLVNLPNPAYTDAAHRNGVRSLGCWFWPRSGDFEDYLEQRPDGSFPVADKLIEMSAYFGFDGYFINHEAETPPGQAARLYDLLRSVRERAPEGFHLQWYDTITPDGRLDYLNHLNADNAPWLDVSDSFFANYWMTPEGVETSRATALKLGRDPYGTVFHGTENEQFGFDPEYDPRLLFPPGEAARTSWALFGSHFVKELAPHHDDPDVQDEVFRRERRYWSGPHEDPTRSGRLLPHDREKPRDRDDHRAWDGVAHHITERSVIGSFPFVTRFNTGHGRAFFLDGQRASDGDWHNASVQDVLPTWQFWTRAEGTCAEGTGAEGTGAALSVGFDHELAYDGGSSLLVSGPLGPDGATTVRLYKTALAVTGPERLAVTAHGTDSADLEVGLLFQDAPDTFTWLAAESAAGWHTTTHGLAPFQGRTIAAVGLRLSSRRPIGCAVRIGELALLGAEFVPPAPPQDFTVDEVLADGEAAHVFLSWRLAGHGVHHYDLLRDDGSWLGRTYDDVYCLSLPAPAGPQTAARLRLVAVAPDGSRSAPATTDAHWPR